MAFPSLAPASSAASSPSSNSRIRSRARQSRERPYLRRRYRQTNVIRIDPVALANRAAYVVDVIVVHDGEKPGTQIGARFPQPRSFQRTEQRVLHQIIGAVTVAEQRHRVTSKSRNLGADEREQGIHADRPQ